MLKVRTLCPLFFAFFSVCVGATFMQNSIYNNKGDFEKEFGESVSCSHEAACQRWLSQPNHGAKKIYAEAFTLSLNDQWEQAQEAAECAAHLNLGHHGWNIE